MWKILEVNMDTFTLNVQPERFRSSLGELWGLVLQLRFSVRYNCACATLHRTTDGPLSGHRDWIWAMPQMYELTWSRLQMSSHLTFLETVCFTLFSFTTIVHYYIYFWAFKFILFKLKQVVSCVLLPCAIIAVSLQVLPLLGRHSKMQFIRISA